MRRAIVGRAFRRLAGMDAHDIDRFFATLQAANPHPVTELEYTSVFELLAAVLLSAQATDVGVNKATRRLFPVANTPEQILALGLEGLEGYIRTIGLYRSKARHLMAACRILVEQHGGAVPRTREALQALPGVGRKTANVVLGNAFDIPSGIVVDTHVSRLSNRLGWVKGTEPVAIENRLKEFVPEQNWIKLSHELIFHGRQICKARRPLCEKCFLFEHCPKKGV